VRSLSMISGIPLALGPLAGNQEQDVRLSSDHRGGGGDESRLVLVGYQCCEVAYPSLRGGEVEGAGQGLAGLVAASRHHEVVGVDGAGTRQV
jgi:hypothetical protein